MKEKKDYAVSTAFINSFAKGAIETFRVQCNVDVTPEKPYIRAPDEKSKIQIEIAGLVGISSDKFQGSIAICFPEKTFLGVMSKMLGENFTEINSDLEDGAGELMNIVYGTAKRILNEQGYNLQKALPNVVRGTNVQLRHVGTGTTLVVPFRTPIGSFEIEVGVEFEKMSGAA